MPRTATTSGPTHVRLMPESSRRILVYRNGEPQYKGITIVLNTRQVHNIGALLDLVSERIGLVLGCKRLFTPEGTPVTAMDQLEHNKAYVASSGVFTPAQYGRQRSATKALFGARRGSASGGARSSSNFSSSKDDSLAQSFSSKQSAPASLGVHVPLRQSRSIESRRPGAAIGGRAQPTANGPTISRRRDRSGSTKTPSKGATKNGGNKKEPREGSKKRKTSMKKKASTEVPAAKAAPLSSMPPAPPTAQSEGEERTPTAQSGGETERTVEQHHPATGRSSSRREMEEEHNDGEVEERRDELEEKLEKEEVEGPGGQEATPPANNNHGSSERAATADDAEEEIQHFEEKKD